MVSSGAEPRSLFGEQIKGDEIIKVVLINTIIGCIHMLSKEWKQKLTINDSTVSLVHSFSTSSVFSFHLDHATAAMGRNPSKPFELQISNVSYTRWIINPLHQQRIKLGDTQTNHITNYNHLTWMWVPWDMYGWFCRWFVSQEQPTNKGLAY